MAVKSVGEIYTDAKNEIQSRKPALTDFNDGSLLDVLTGAMSQAVSEIQRTALEEFAKTFVETSSGPEVTGGADDLARLLVDHFGDEFERPIAAKAAGTVTFSRPTATAGDCTILAGAVVKTAPNAAGTSQRFTVLATVTMVGLSISASVEALVAGIAGNVAIAQVSTIETTLTDTTIVVTNSDAMSGGTELATDAEYREFARDLLTSLRGATLAAIEAKAQAVSGVEKATGIEALQTVIEYNEATALTTGAAFKIARNKLYVADANGTASPTLIALVVTAIESVRAAGVKVEVIGASAVTQNIAVLLTLNAGGPNYASLSLDPQPILDDIREYVQGLAIGTGLVRADLKTSVLATWGPSGSNDLTDLTVTVPSGDVAVTALQKIIPGTVTKV